MKAQKISGTNDVPATWAIGLLVTTLLAPPAYAELEEIIVTATKREERIQDVPIAITAFSDRDLQERSAYKLTDITSAVPNVALSETNNTENSNSFTVRGLTTTFNNPGISPGVGVYFDGVYQARNAVFESALTNIQSVEFLKGPQGTLFGRNTIQGAINVVTKKPTDEFESEVEVSVGNYNMWQVSGTVSGPISYGKVSGSLSAYAREREGTVEDIAQNTTLNGQEYSGARAKLRFTPADRWDITLAADVHKDDTSSQTTDQFPIDYVVATSGVFGGEPQVFERDIVGGSIDARYQLGEYEMVSITGVRSFDHTFSNDQDFTPFRFLDRVRRDESADWASQEFRIVSPAGETFDWLAGVYLYSQKGDATVFGDFGPDFGPPIFFVVDSHQDIESYAIFANSNWHASERLTVNLGLRYTWEDQSFDFQQDSNFFPSIPQFSQDLSSSELSPTISLIYSLSDDVNAYVKFANGFKSGGFNNTLAFADSREITSVDPEFVDSYEVGMKGYFFDDRLQLNLAAFYLDYTDRQISSFVNPIVGFAFANAAASKSHGAELELTAQATDNLTFQFGAGYNDGEFDVFLNCTGPGTDCSGDPLGTPNLNLTGSVNYQRALANGMSLVARMDGYYQEEPDARPNPSLIQPDERTLVNARIGLTSASDSWEVALWGRNLTEDDGTTYSQSFIGELTGGLPEPRTYGIDLAYRFK